MENIVQFKKKQTLQTKDLLIEELKKLIKACIKFVGKKRLIKNQEESRFNKYLKLRTIVLF